MRLADLVGARLREARGDRRAIDLASEIGVDVSTLYRWEAGKSNVPHEQFMLVAYVYGRPWQELFDPTPAGV